MPRSTYWGGGTVIAAAVWWFFLEFVKELFFGALGTWVTSRMSDDGAQLLFDYVVPYGPPILLLSLGLMALSGVGQNIHITASPPFFRKVKGKDAPATQSIQTENLNPWIPVREAITHIVQSMGFSSTTEADDYHLKVKATRELRQAGLRGEVRMEGQKETHRRMRGSALYSDVRTQIHDEYWEIMELDVGAIDEVDVPHTRLEFSRSHDPIAKNMLRYSNLHVRKADLDLKWPQRKRHGTW